MIDIVERLKAAAAQATETNKVTPTRELDQKLYLDAAEEIQRLRSMREWKSASEPPNDGRPILMIARLNIDGEKPQAMVGHWHLTEHEWRAIPIDQGTKLMLFYWMELPELPQLPEFPHAGGSLG